MIIMGFVLLLIILVALSTQQSIQKQEEQKALQNKLKASRILKTIEEIGIEIEDTDKEILIEIIANLLQEENTVKF